MIHENTHTHTHTHTGRALEKGCQLKMLSLLLSARFLPHTHTHTPQTKGALLNLSKGLKLVITYQDQGVIYCIK